MKWRFVDRVTRLEAWREIAGWKVVSLEEYFLGRPLGRLGSCPASLQVAALVDLGRWLTAASSSFASTCTLAGVEELRFLRAVGAGERLDLAGRVLTREQGTCTLECSIRSAGNEVARGRLALELVPLAELCDPEAVRGMWEEIHGQA